MPSQPRVAIVGAGRLAKTLAPALRDAGYGITEIIARDSRASRRRAQLLARRVGARAEASHSARRGAQLLWLCVPDREVGSVAAALAKSGKGTLRLAFHSSGALSSRDLEPLRKIGIAVASVHPLMTFVAGARPSLRGVPFAIEGDPAATGWARRIVRDLGGESFLIPVARKAAYHAWATMTSPLLLAFLVTLEEAATLAGLTRIEARRKSLPMIRQTLENYSRLGPDHSFSGPIIRGDAGTVAKHLAVVKKNRLVRDAYLALARSALRRLPAGNRKELLRLLKE